MARTTSFIGFYKWNTIWVVLGMSEQLNVVYDYMKRKGKKLILPIIAILQMWRIKTKLNNTMGYIIVFLLTINTVIISIPIFACQFTNQYISNKQNELIKTHLTTDKIKKELRFRSKLVIYNLF